MKASFVSHSSYESTVELDGVMRSIKCVDGVITTDDQAVINHLRALKYVECAAPDPVEVPVEASEVLAESPEVVEAPVKKSKKAKE